MKKLLTPIIGEYESKIFYPFMLVIIIGVIAAGLQKDAILGALSTTNNWLITNCGWFLQLLAVVLILFTFVIICTKYGNIKMGKPEDKPEFSLPAWISMMFCAAFGMTMWMWCAAEIMYHIFQFDLLADQGIQGTGRTMSTAFAYMVMDNTLHGWALFALGGLAIGLPAYRKGIPMNLAAGLYGIMGEKCTTSKWGRVVDIIGAVASVGGVAGALGMGIAILTSGMKAIFGFEASGDNKMTVELICLFILTGFFIITAVVGIEKGMKRLSMLNISFSIAIVAFVFIFGPTVYIGTAITQGLGEYINSFFALSTWGDAGNFVDGEWKNRMYMNWWLIFFIMWWISYIPFCGGFVARISKGRTLREYFLCGVLCPSLMTVIFFGTWSSLAAYLQFTGGADVWGAINNDFGSTIYVVAGSLPFGKIVMFLVFCSAVFYGVTTYDSTTQFVAIQMAGGNIHTKAPLRVFVGLVIGGMGILALSTGQLNLLKALPIVFGAPFVIVLMVYFYSIIKMLGMCDRGEM